VNQKQSAAGEWNGVLTIEPCTSSVHTPRRHIRSDPANLQERGNIVTLNGEVTESALPLTVPIGSARDEKAGPPGDRANAFGVGVVETRTIAFDAVESACDEAGELDV
jgi:hypothetical protein